jgi:hypothetical protein
MSSSYVDRRSLGRLPQKDVVHLVRVLRVFVNSLRMYPQEHPVLLKHADRLVGHLCDAHRAHGDLLLDGCSYLLAINECSIDRDLPEFKESVELAAWLRERGVQTIWIQGVLLADDLLDVFGWLAGTDPDECRDALEAGRRPEVKGPLAVNPTLEAPRSVAPEPGPGLEAMPDGGPAVLFSGGGPASEEEDTLTGQPRYRSRDVAIQEGLQETVAKMFTGPFGPEGLLSSLMVSGDPVAALADDLVQRLPQWDLGQVYAVVQAQAVVSLVSLKAPDLADFLARTWPEPSAGARLRAGVLEALDGKPFLALEVLGKLGNAVYGGTTGDGSGPAIEVLETHVPWLLQSGQRREALRAVQVLDRLVHDDQRTRSLRQRADIGLRRICRTSVVRSLLQQLKAFPGGDPETEELLYLLGSRSVARTLEELREADDKAVRLDLVDVLTVIGRMAQAHGDDPDEVFAPLDAVLDGGGQAPWYLVRNVVLVLGRVGTPRMRERLVARLRDEQEPRVLTEITLGLMNSASKETLKVLGDSLLGGRLASAEAFQGLLPALLEHDQKGTFKGLENLLLGGTLSPHATRVSMNTLLHVLGERSEPFMKRVFNGRPLFRRRLVFDEATRAAAVEALGQARGPWVDRLLLLAERDPSAEIRDRVQDLRQEDSPTGVFRVVTDDPSG